MTSELTTEGEGGVSQISYHRKGGCVDLVLTRGMASKI